MNNPVLKRLEDNQVANNTLLLEPPVKEKKVNEEVTKAKAVFDKYGIKNTTQRFIKEKTDEIRQSTEESKLVVAKGEVLKSLSKSLFPFKVISYKTLHDICVDYNLYIGPLDAFESKIPEEVLEDLEVFTNKLSSEELRPLANAQHFQENKNPTFDLASYNQRLIDPYDRAALSLDKAFKIAGTKKDFNVESFNLVVGRELCKVKDVSFKWKPTLQKPTMKDPILFFPIKLMNEVYCAVVQAWDKEGDDSRLRVLLEEA